MLADYPIFRTVPELGRELGVEAVDRAIAELIGCGVIRLPDPDSRSTLLPSARIMVSFGKRLGRNVAAIRRRAGQSQEDLSFRSGVHRTSIGKIERGEIPRSDSLLKLAGAKLRRTGSN